MVVALQELKGVTVKTFARHIPGLPENYSEEAGDPALQVMLIRM